jgi:creatinine amidohydrolase
MDLHANKAETDLILFLYPESVDTESIEDDPDRTEETVFSYPVAQTSLNGLTGAPSRASAAQGRELFLKMTTALAGKIEIAKTEKPPLPSEEWSDLPKLTF